MKHTSNSIKGFAMPLVIAIIAVVVVLGGVAYYANRPQTTEEDKMVQEKAMMEKEAMEQKEKEVMMDKEENVMMEKKEDGAMMNKGDTMMTYSGTVLAGSKAKLLDFTKADYDTAIASDKLVVLYFYANWCPICRAEFPKMQQAFNELDTDTVVGFRVNYNDNETDGDEKALAREHGVAYQHTKVFLKGENRILKAPDGWEKDRYLSEIGKAIGQ